MAAVVSLPTVGSGRWAVTLVRKSRNGRTVKRQVVKVGNRTTARLLAAKFREDTRTVAVRVQDGS